MMKQHQISMIFLTIWWLVTNSWRKNLEFKLGLDGILILLAILTQTQGYLLRWGLMLCFLVEWITRKEKNGPQKLKDIWNTYGDHHQSILVTSTKFLPTFSKLIIVSLKAFSQEQITIAMMHLSMIHLWLHLMPTAKWQILWIGYKI